MTIRADILHVDGAVLRSGTEVRYVETVRLNTERERNALRLRVVAPCGRWWTVAPEDVQWD